MLPETQEMELEAVTPLSGRKAKKSECRGGDGDGDGWGSVEDRKNGDGVGDFSYGVCRILEMGKWRENDIWTLMGTPN